MLCFLCTVLQGYDSVLQICNIFYSFEYYSFSTTLTTTSNMCTILMSTYLTNLLAAS